MIVYMCIGNVMFEVLQSMFSDVSLTRQTIHTYDDFISRIVPMVVDASKPVRVRSNILIQKPTHTFEFSHPDFKDITFIEKNGDIHYLTPMEARLRDFTYSAPMYIDIKHTVGKTRNDVEEIIRQDGKNPLLLNKKPTKRNKKYFDMLGETTMHRSVYVGRMPVMTRSSLCALKDDDSEECAYDPGGYFIVNGRERTLICQERILTNHLFLFDHAKYKYQSIVFSSLNNISHNSVHVRMHGLHGINSPIVILMTGVTKHAGLSKEINLLTILKALTGYNEEKIIHDIARSKELLEATIFDQTQHTTKECQEYLMKHSKCCDSIQQLIDECWYPHLKTLEQQYTASLDQCRALLDGFRGLRTTDDRDHYRNKRIDTAGALLASLFYQLFDNFKESVQKIAQTYLDKNKKISMKRIVSTSIITDGLKYALATGNWRVKGTTSGREGVSQLLNRNTYISCISQLRRVDSGVGASQKVILPRLLWGNQWGFKCASETPEGGPCGLVGQMTLSSFISIASDPDKVLEITKSFRHKNGVRMYHNGIYLYNVKRARDLIKRIKHARRSRTISNDVSVCMKHNEVHIFTDAGRFCRPLFCCPNGQWQLTDTIVEDLSLKRIHWDDLYSLGIIENLDVMESETALIAETRQGLIPECTHCELHPSMILGTLVSTIPYPDHNQSPRNTYQGAMGKQAQGIYATNYRNRFDTSGHILHYPQKPLVSTMASKHALHGNTLPAGHNAIVAIMCYGGFNQEDSLLFNQHSIDRGFGRSTTFRTYTADDQLSMNGKSSVFAKPSSKTRRSTNPEMYNALDENGMAITNKPVKKGQAIIGRVSKMLQDGEEVKTHKQRDESILNKKSNGVVDNTIIFQNERGGQTIKTKIREHKIPQIGDKFSSRHGQKGTIGMTYGQQDLPFTIDGMTPDIIVNPHAIPSRMTGGHMIECLASKVSALTGTSIDATAFDHKSVDDLCAMLKAAGMHPKGNEMMMNGFTGKMMECKVFLGPTYYQKLKHMVSDKMHYRTKGRVVNLTRQPCEGRAKGGGLRWGEMERDVGIAHGAAEVLYERMTLGSDVSTQPVCTSCGIIDCYYDKFNSIYKCKACDTATIKEVDMPYAAKLLMQELMSMGVQTKLKI